MKLSSAGLNLLKRSEGFRSHAYRDANGFLTIGYGHRLSPAESFPQGIGEPQAARILTGDVSLAERAVRRLVKVPLSQGQFDALVDFCFNLGPERLASSSLLDELNARKYSAAVQQLLLWDHADGREIAALKARREAEARLWRSGEQRQAVA